MAYIKKNGVLRDSQTGVMIMEFDRTDNAVEMSLSMFKGMVSLAHTDPGMKDLLLRAKEYYILRGSPASHVFPNGWAYASNNPTPGIDK